MKDSIYEWRERNERLAKLYAELEQNYSIDCHAVAASARAILKLRREQEELNHDAT